MQQRTDVLTIGLACVAVGLAIGADRGSRSSETPSSKKTLSLRQAVANYQEWLKGFKQSDPWFVFLSVYESMPDSHRRLIADLANKLLSSRKYENLLKIVDRILTMEHGKMMWASIHVFYPSVADRTFELMEKDTGRLESEDLTWLTETIEKSVVAFIHGDHDQ